MQNYLSSIYNTVLSDIRHWLEMSILNIIYDLKYKFFLSHGIFFSETSFPTASYTEESEGHHQLVVDGDFQPHFSESHTQKHFQEKRGFVNIYALCLHLRSTF